MPRKFKVWGGLTFENGRHVRTIIATQTKRSACVILNKSFSDFSNYWCETGNEIELETALSEPGAVFKSSSSMVGANDFKKVKKENEPDLTGAKSR
jgi:hypothetical protein